MLDIQITSIQVLTTTKRIMVLRNIMNKVEAATGTRSDRQSPSRSSNAAGDAPVLPQRCADESYKLFSKIQTNGPTPEEARIIRNKCLWRILPFLCIGYHLMYIDKQTVMAYCWSDCRP